MSLYFFTLETILASFLFASLIGTPIQTFAKTTDPLIIPYSGPASVPSLIAYYALRYDLEPWQQAEMQTTVECESGFDADIQSKYIDSAGNREESFGLAQINLKYHPNISIEEAKDPYYSLSFMAAHFKKDSPEQLNGLWSCHKKYFPAKAG